MQAQKTKITNINLNPKRLAFILEMLVLLLAVLSITGQAIRFYTVYDEAFGLIPLVNMAKSLSIPTIYAILLQFSAALLLGAVSILKHNQKDTYRWHWTAMALWFLHMSFNIGTPVHKALIMPLRRLALANFPGFPRPVLTISAAFLLVILLVFYVKFFKELPARTKKMTLIAFGVYLLGFICMEFVMPWHVDLNGADNLLYNIIVTVGRSLKMSSMILLIFTIIQYIQMTFKEITLEV